VSVMHLADRTWTEAAGAAGAAGAVVAVPLGSTEQHGPHLPLGTDTVVAAALAHRLAQARPTVWVAPALPYGASGEHAGFAGTLSVGTSALTGVLIELGRSADAFGGLVLVCGHGGNAAALAQAVGVLTEEGRRVLAWLPTLRSVPGPGLRTADAHAGRVETSLMLALDPTAVRLELAAAGNRQPLGSLMPDLRSVGVAGVSANGVLGDPAGASAAEGKELLEQLTGDLIGAFDRWVVS
jgi:mycofactocin precursor peptide peptidase